jgi:hypothetical protein
MDELLTTTPTLADRQVQCSDASFEIAFGPSGTMSPNRDLINSARWGVTVITPISSIAGDPESGGLFLSEAQARFLTQIGSDLDELPEPVRSSPGAELCRQFVAGDGLALASIPSVRCAVFGDEEDGVELVAHSRASLRQVSLEFKPDENSINIVSIDEEMRRFERACGIEKVRTLAEAIAWLNPH